MDFESAMVAATWEEYPGIQIGGAGFTGVNALSGTFVAWD
jgi:hypothetical protein